MAIFASPYVKVLSIHDSRPSAWALSRPKSSTPISEVEDLDMSLQDLRTVTIEFGASAAFRELLTIIRPSATWATSSRNRFMEDIPLTSYAAVWTQATFAYDRAQDSAKSYHQDKARAFLPLAHFSPFTYQVSWRTIISILLSIKERFPLYWEYYGKPLQDQLGIEVEKTCYRPIHNAYITPEYTSSDHLDKDVSSYGIRIIRRDIPIGLRAQLVRQNQIKLYDTLWNLKEKTLECMTIADNVSCVIVMSDVDYMNIVRRRSCLIAQTDLWWSFISNAWSEFGPTVMPCECDRDKCTMKAEAELCLRREAATLSCPIYDGKKSSLDGRAEYMGEDHPAILKLRDWIGKNLE